MDRIGFRRRAEYHTRGEGIGMEPLSLATAAITFLVPFFKHALEGTAGKLGERAGETIADATLPKVKALYEQVRTKLAPDSYRIALLNGVKAAPEETSRQEILKAELAKVIESDSEFANELERLLSEVEKAGGERIVANQT